MDVSVAAGLLSRLDGAAQVGKNGFEAGDDGLNTLGFRGHGEQALIEIEIKGKRSGR